MKNEVAWIDDISLLMVNVEEFSNLYRKENDCFIDCGERFIFPNELKKVDDFTVLLGFSEVIPLGKEMKLMIGDRSLPIYARHVVRSSTFENMYSCVEETLGTVCNESGTSFAIWAPTAFHVKLFLNNKKIFLNRNEKGVWKTHVKGDCHGQEYEYEIEINGKVERVIDPYVKALTPNSEKGVVINLSKTRVEEVDRPFTSHLQDAIIYELHVRDATIHEESGVINKGKYLGLTENETTTSSGYSTALSYLKELGCTHVEFLPVNDFARVDELNPNEFYNWGYDPLFYQVPEGSYCLRPEDPLSRLNELKQMIQTLHKEGLAVILDVVYNHVYKIEECSFEKIVPGYYFRYHLNGQLSNGTGVGNDIASERVMVRKFILDTIDYWLKEYNVDGFRFDLMGALDVETMNKIKERCLEEDNPIMLLGEGWELPTALDNEQKATSFQSHRLKGTRFFNDFFRDSLKGDLFDLHSLGFVNGKGRFIERLPHLVSGCTLEEFGNPVTFEMDQVVNYIECHDNHTLWDKLAVSNEEEEEDDRKRMHQLGTGITLLSQGVPFLHAGQEWFRTKKGDGNSYISGDQINQLDWQAREKEEEHISFIRKLINIRKEHEVFRLKTKNEIRRRLHILQTPAPLFGWTLFGTKEDFTIYVNPTKKRFEVHLPSSGNWEVCATNDRNRNESEIVGEHAFVEPYELIVLKKMRR